ncbi:hypothetical protein MRY82_10155 [bacterium]|nr:hypothetical protein [bacterium]
MALLDAYPKPYWLIVLCLLLSSAILYVLPQRFWLRFYVSVSQVNSENLDEERFIALKKQFLPQSTQCKKSSAQNTYFCTLDSTLKSKQKKYLKQIQNNRRYGFLSKAAFSDLLEQKVSKIQQLRQSNVDLELKLIDLDEKLSEEDKKIIQTWQSQMQAIENELNYNQQRLTFFENAQKQAEESDSSPSLYQEKVQELQNTIAELELEMSSLNTQKENFNANQIVYLKTQEKLNSNNEERETLIKKTSFLEDLNNSYSNQNHVPDPEKTQWQIKNLSQKTQRYSLAKLFYVIPLAALLFGLCIHGQQHLVHTRNQYNLNTDDMAQIINAPFLGDLNPFLLAGDDHQTSADN